MEPTTYVFDMIRTNLGSGGGPSYKTILSLFIIIWSALLPLALYKKVYVFSVGYGYSVMVTSIVLLYIVFPSNTTNTETAAAATTTTTTASDSDYHHRLLAICCGVYGGRLGSYLLIRELTRKAKKPTTMTNGSIISRVIMSASLSLFYSMLMTPALYSLRATKKDVSFPPVLYSMRALDEDTTTFSTNSPSFFQVMLMTGLCISILGGCIETVADLQKYVVKQSQPPLQKAKDVDDTKQELFVGPTNGVYRLSRHPNYLGHILFWLGQFIGGIPSLNGIAPWVCSLLGVVGIFNVMKMSTGRLEKQQKEKYNGQPDYDQWIKEVPWSLFPFVP
jgi:steroid 5-alpha reductase family enzyme